FDDVGDLGDTQQRCHAWQDVLAGGGGGSQNVRVAPCYFCHQRGNVLGQQVVIGCVVCMQHLAHASNRRGGLRCGAAAGTGNQDGDILVDGLGGSECTQGGCFQGSVAVFCNDQYTHGINLLISNLRNGVRSP